MTNANCSLRSFCLLVLATAHEILRHPKLVKIEKILTNCVTSIRSIGKEAVGSNVGVNVPVLKRVLRYLQRASAILPDDIKEKAFMSIELVRLIRHAIPATTAKPVALEDLEVVKVLSVEAEPTHLLEALLAMKSEGSCDPKTLRLVSALLSRATYKQAQSEMSVALMQIKHARLTYRQESEAPIVHVKENRPESLWHSMLNGTLTIAK